MAAIDPNQLTFLRNHWQTALSLTLMAIAILVGLPIVLRLKREVAEENEPITPADILSEIEQAHAEGEIDDAELRRVRELVIRPGNLAPGQDRPAPRRRAPGASPDPERESSPPPDDPGGSSGPS